MEQQELKNMNEKELLNRCEELKGLIYALKSSGVQEKKEQSAKAIREHKKEIARIKTMLRQRELNI